MDGMEAGDRGVTRESCSGPGSRVRLVAELRTGLWGAGGRPLLLRAVVVLGFVTWGGLLSTGRS